VTTGQNIADEARADLSDGDSSNYRWSSADILVYINAAIREIITLVPEAGAVEDTMSPVPGTRQEIPNDGIKFLGVTNVIIDGADITRGHAATEVEYDSLNSSFPDWAWTILLPDEDDPDNWVAHHFAHDPREPTTFDVYPECPDDDQALLVKYVQIPSPLAALSEVFPLRAEFVNPAVLYTKYRMVSKDGRQQASPTVRAEMWDNFRSSLGLKIESEKRVDPATYRPPADNHG
jgi:hypothetical protein